MYICCTKVSLHESSTTSVLLFSAVQNKVVVRYMYIVFLMYWLHEILFDTWILTDFLAVFFVWEVLYVKYKYAQK